MDSVVDVEYLGLNESLALKELGFDEPCLTRFFGEKRTIATTFGCKNSDEVPSKFDFRCTSPSYHQAYRWLYEKLGIKNGVMPLDILLIVEVMEELIINVKKMDKKTISIDQRTKLRKLWFIYGNDGPKHSHTNHRYIQNFLENGEDTESFYNQPHTKEKISEDCLKEVKAIIYPNN